MSQCEHAVIGQLSCCPNKSPPDVAVMTQSLMTQQPVSPSDVYSIAVMTKSSSKVGNLLIGQISHAKIYYGQIVLLSNRKANSTLSVFRGYSNPLRRIFQLRIPLLRIGLE
jgi:hypothetical protein